MTILNSKVKKAGKALCLMGLSAALAASPALAPAGVWSPGGISGVETAQAATSASATGTSRYITGYNASKKNVGKIKCKVNASAKIVSSTATTAKVQVNWTAYYYATAKAIQHLPRVKANMGTANGVQSVVSRAGKMHAAGTAKAWTKLQTVGSGSATCQYALSGSSRTQSVKVTASVENNKGTTASASVSLSVALPAAAKASTWTVSFADPQGATGTQTKSVSSASPQVTMPAARSREGYEFVGWADGARVYAPATTVSVNGSKTFLAVWKAEPTYTVSFSANGGEGYIAPVTGLLAGKELVLPEGGMQRDGCLFSGWALSVEGSQVVFSPGETLSVGGSYVDANGISRTWPENAVLLAVWEVDESAREKALADQRAAEAVQDKVTALMGSANPTQADIIALRDAYAALTDDQKALVSLYEQAVVSAQGKVAARAQAAQAATKSAAAASSSAKSTTTAAKTTAKKVTAKKAKKTYTIGKNVIGYSKRAFAGSAYTTLVVKSKRLTKASMKGALKGSKVKTIRVKVSKKHKVNKKWARAYKKVFAKKACGKSVKLKAA